MKYTRNTSNKSIKISDISKLSMLKSKTNAIPLVNSIIGYLKLIDLPQYLHFERWSKNENIGIRSCHINWWLQFGQYDLPLYGDNFNGIR
jgi:hypothetical protein